MQYLGTIHDMITTRRMALSVLTAAVLLLGAGCSTETSPIAPGPFGPSEPALPGMQERADTGTDQSIDPGIQVPMDSEGMEIPSVETPEEPAPMPTIDVDGGGGADQIAV